MKLTRFFRFLTQIPFRRPTICTPKLHPYHLLDQRDEEKIKREILAGLRERMRSGNDRLA
jgi:hypothetical protein